MKKNDNDKIITKNKLLKKRVKELESLLADKTSGSIPFSSDYIYRTLFRLSPYSIVVSRLEDGKIYDVSDNFCRRSGFSRKESIGRTGTQLSLWLESDRKKFVSIIKKEGGYRNREVNHRLRNGSVITCLESVEPIPIQNENYIITIVTDITALKKAQTDLIEERDLSNAIINSLPGLYYIFDEEGRFLRWNDNLLKILGCSAKELPGMKCVDFHREAERQMVAEEIKKIFLFGENKLEADVVMKDGMVRTFLLSAKRFNYQKKPCAVGTGIDITEQKRIENELKSHAESLEDANIALRVLMHQKIVDQKDVEEKLQVNVNDLVLPYLQKLKKAGLDNRNKNYLAVLERNLRDVLSPFMKNFEAAHKNLTPQEIQIIDLIKQGKKTKEIAVMLDASVKTIETHRNNIRKKLNLIKAKVNLRSHILSLK